MQSWTKVMRHFRETDAFELTIVFDTFFICSHHPPSPPPPPHPNNVAKRLVDVYLCPTLKKGEGETNFYEGKGENLHLGIKKHGNFHVSQQLLSMIVDKHAGISFS